MKTGNVLQLIKQNQGRFSNQQAKIADYILTHHDKAAFLTATQLAKEADVSQPTVIRFSQFLGFPQFSMFASAVQSLLKEELTSTERLRLSLGDPRAEGREISDDPAEFDIIYKEIRTLERLASTFPHKQFEQLVSQICECNRIFIVGTRGSASLTQHFAYFLSKVKSHVIAVDNGATRTYDQLLHLNEKDLVIAIAFPRYPRETIEIAKFCCRRGATVFGITDRIESPLAEQAHTSLVIPITFSTIFDAYGSAFCLFNMLVTRVGRTNSKESETLSRRFEVLAREVKIFL
ncbi:MAG: MurR/RpiR family transcriptional regulator [Desulfobacteraceae bacterium]|nr:MurR/RpiR family transcriptional regulator [Desulfobacteraceae bacterium]MBC2751914.1 MurR/RpiR family transcriptional regulator [Desulfobacteraceae bacterium]